MTETPSTRAEWRGGWKLVLAAASGMSLSPLIIYTMGLFVMPLEHEFGWSRTMITSGLTLVSVVGVIFAAPFGALIDRFGPRRIAIPGVALFCLSFASLATLDGEELHWWAIWACIAVASLLVKPTVWTAAVASRFDNARGLALAIALSGSGLTGIMAPAVAGYLIENHGWRPAYSGLGLLWFSVSIVLVLWSFYGATDLLRTKLVQQQKAERSHINGLGVVEAVRSASFLKLVLACFMIILTVTGGLVHFVPVIVERGIDRGTAVPLASAVGLAAFLGRMITGSLLDRFDARYVGVIAFAMPGIACCALLMLNGQLPLAVVIALLLGFSSGAELEVASYLSSRFFGMRNFGTLFGFVVGVISLASGIGPILASVIFDRLGSYDAALWAGALLAFLASMLLGSLGRYRTVEHDVAAA